MVANVSVLSNEFKINAARQIAKDLADGTGSTYYMCAGNHVPLSNNSILPTAPNNDIRSLVQDVYWNMIFSKKLSIANFSLLIKNIPWVSNTVYTQYDDNNPNLVDLSYYVMVQEGVYTHVYKCLENNNGNPSSVQPVFSDISLVDDELYELSDGYRWKYMYSADDVVINLFGTPTYFPVVPNTAVQAIASPGALNVIAVDYEGAGYANWLLGSFAAADLRINGSQTTYSLSTNSMISTTNGYYEGCVLYLSSGSGIGQFKNVVSYSVTNLGNFITIDSPFTINPQVNDSYEIYPNVLVVGGGTQTQNAVARAIVNSAGNTISRIEMLQSGADYNYISASVYANNIVSVTGQALVRPIYSPPGGHGSDPASELGDAFLGITTQFEYAEGNTIPITNTYKQLSLLQSPAFSNVVLNFTTISGTFEGFEPVFEIDPEQVATGVTVNEGSNVVINTVGDFTTTFDPGDFIYISNGSTQQLSQVNSVTNSSYLQITAAALFSDANSTVYLPQANLAGTVVALNAANVITLSNVVSMSANVGTQFVGFLSGGLGVLSAVSRSNQFKTFDTFIGNFQYPFAYVSGTFSPNETVFQGPNLNSSTANALVHSVNNSILLVTEQIGTMDQTVNLIGETSGAIATISNTYFPEIVYASGKVLYVENLIPVSRNNQIDTIKLVISLKPL